MPRARAAASVGLLLVALVAALTGCSDTSLLNSPATGDVVVGSAYRFTAPAGWTEVSAEERPPGADIEVVNGGGQPGAFVDSLTVVASPVGALTPEQVESDGVSELSAAGLRDVTTQDRIVVGGAESAHLTFTRLTNDESSVIDQYYLTRDDQTWVATFSFDADTSQQDRDDLAGSVLVTWQWT